MEILETLSVFLMNLPAEIIDIINDYRYDFAHMKGEDWFMFLVFLFLILMWPIGLYLRAKFPEETAELDRQNRLKPVNFLERDENNPNKVGSSAWIANNGNPYLPGSIAWTNEQRKDQ